MQELHEHTTEDVPACVPGEVHPASVLTVLVAGTILAPLDSSIVNIALPSVAAHFDVRLSAVGWVTTSYLLTTASLLLTMGRLGDVWGLRRLYIAGLLVFGVGSASCALSPSLSLLVASRVVQAVGASMLFAAGPALVTRTFSSDRRGWALGYIALSVSVGLTAGPALGGLLVGTFGWQSIFIINLPLVLVVSVLSWRLLPEECPDHQRFDPLGALLAAGALFGVLAGLGQADRLGVLDGRVLLPAAGGVALGVAFVWWERRATAPMVDLRLFDNAAFTAGVGAATLAYMALFSATFTMPFYLTRIHGIDTRLAGLLLTITPLTMAAIAPAAGRLSDRRGSRGLATAGIAVLGAGLLVASSLRADTPVSFVALSLALIGIGMAVFQTPNTASILRATPRSNAGVGSAFVSVARNVGMSLGVALTAAIVGAAVGNEGLPSVRNGVAPQVAERFATGMSTSLRVAAGLALLGVALSWYGRRPDSVESGGAKL